MDGIVDDVQILDHRVGSHFAHSNEVIGSMRSQLCLPHSGSDSLWHTTIGTNAIPISLAISINDVTWGSLNRDSGSSDCNWVEGGNVSEAESSLSSKGDHGTGFKASQGNGAV
jgi:hypothetical protein